MLLVAESDHAQAFGLCQPRKVGDGNSHQSKYRVDVVGLQRIDDQVESIGHCSFLDG
jgi:hypothetical protein